MALKVQGMERVLHVVFTASPSLFPVPVSSAAISFAARECGVFERETMRYLRSVAKSSWRVDVNVEANCSLFVIWLVGWFGVYRN